MSAIWNTLKTHHKESSHMKESRINIGVRTFEMFEMTQSETIDEMNS